MKTLIEILEIPTILKRIQGYARTYLGQQWIMDSTFIPPSELAKKAFEVKEMMEWHARYQPLPIDFHHDLLPILAYLKKGSVIQLEGLNAIHLDVKTVDKVLGLFKPYQSQFPSLQTVMTRLFALPRLQKAIEQILAPNGMIRDEASIDLMRIRKRIRSLDAQMLSFIQEAMQRYQSYLTDHQYTLKNGHYVLPISTSNKSFVPGMIHDVSSTGLTTFIEPKTLVDIGLEKQLLHGEEQEEIFQILKVMTEQIIPELEILQTNHETLAYFDVVQSKAHYGRATDGYLGVLSSTPRIDIQGARHPLIDPKIVVKNSFYLDEKKAIVIISGPNAGGKTVAMKTVGLLVYLHQLAIPLPTDQPAVLSYFKQIFADIGDQQSVLENLSTFAGHIQNLVPLTDQVKPFDLVLIDELGTGTDPKEGEALARSLLIHLQAKRAFVMVSSHFPGLKTLALQEPHMINASLQFDEEHLIPTYHFQLGIPGKSYGLVMAKRYGLAPQVVVHAEKYLQQQEASLAQQTLQKIQSELQAIVKEKAQVIEEKNRLIQQEKQTQIKAHQYQQLIDSFQRTIEEKQNEMLTSTRQQVETTIKALANPQLKLHEAIELKKNLQQQGVNTFTTQQVPDSKEPIAVGDYVQEQDTDLVGKVTAVTNQGLTITTADGLTLKVKTSQVQKVAPPKSTKAQPAFRMLKHGHAPSSLNIIGMRYEEAKLALEKYYDLALLGSNKTLKIIHGFGSGTLRNLVYDFFKDMPTVKTIQQGEGEQAGYGVTLIHLK